MAGQYTVLRQAIQDVIKTNGNNEITGALMQQSLLAMITSLGAYYQFVDVATPSTNPGTPDQNVMYFAATAGTYTNFGGIVVNDGEFCALCWNGSWIKKTTGAATAEQVTALGQEVDDFNVVEGDSLFVTDANGNIIARIDKDGVHSVDFLIGETPHNVVESSTLFITDLHGNIAVKIDKNGIHSILDKYAVAGLVLSDAFYPSVTPTRGTDGNVTHADVIFSTGVVGALDLTYANGLASSVAITYGAYNYTMAITRDSDGNVQSVNIS